MGVTKEETRNFLVQLDKEGHQEIYDKLQKAVIILDTEEKADRFNNLVNRFEDNKLAIGLIDIKLVKLGVSEQGYVLKGRKSDLLESNERIINALCRLVGVSK